MKAARDPADVSPPQELREYKVYPALIARCAELEPVTTAVAHPCDQSSLTGAIEAAEAELIRPVLVGPEHKIRAVAEESGLDIAPFRVIDVPHSHAAAARAVELVRAGEAETLMKGSLHTDELMAEVVRKDGGLRTERRVSHAFLMDVPTYHKPLVVTDAAINIFPDLEAKCDIVQNVIDMAHALGQAQPKVAILSAVETVTPKIPSTIDAAALCKMAAAARSPAGCWTARSRSTTPSARRPPGSKAFAPRWRATRTFWWSRISRPATCWRSSSPSSPMRMPPASCSEHGCRSC